MEISIKLGRCFLEFLYFCLKLFPTMNKVTMISRQSNTPSVEFKMIEKKIKEKSSMVKVVLLCKTLDGGAEAGIITRIRYSVHILVQMFHIATSKIVILDTYCIPISLLHHKKSLTVIQMWHSMGTMKKFGYTALDKEEGTKSKLAKVMRMHANYDYVFASAEVYKEDLAKGFHCDISRIVTMPLPRLDLLQSAVYREKRRVQIYQQYPQLKGKPLILYCPTFRKKEERFAEALYQLIEMIDREKYCFVVKLHPLSKIQLGQEVIQAEGFTTFDMLFVADYVISDYSCIVYEAAVLGIPLFFYNFDMDEYLEGRGLAIDYYHELPGVISSDAKEIYDAIEEKKFDRKEIEDFRNKYISPTKHATEDIVDFLLELL